MIRRIALGAAAALLVVGLPVAALAVSRGHSEATVSAQSQVEQTSTSQDGEAAVTPLAQDQAQVQQRQQIHAETGMPSEDYEPTQTRQRLHEQTQVNAEDGTGEQFQGQQRRGGQGGEAGHGSNAGGQGQHGAQAGDGTGECTNPEGPVGNGPSGTSN